MRKTYSLSLRDLSQCQQGTVKVEIDSEALVARADGISLVQFIVGEESPKFLSQKPLRSRMTLKSHVRFWNRDVNSNVSIDYNYLTA